LGRVFSSLPCLNDRDWVGSVFNLGCGGLGVTVTHPRVFSRGVFPYFSVRIVKGEAFYLLFMLKLIKLLLYAVSDRNMTLQELMRWAEKLSAIEKRQLIEKITAEMASESAEVNQPRPSLWGICADLGQAPSAEDIDKTRREAWGDFTVEDL
jgi:hypothetical protein